MTETPKTPEELKQENKETGNKNLEKEGNGKDFLKTANDYAEGLTKNAEEKFAKIPEGSKAQFQGECGAAKKTLDSELTQIANDPDIKDSKERDEKMAEAMNRYLDTVSKAYAKAMGGQLNKDKDQKEQDLFQKEKEGLKSNEWKKEAKEAQKAKEAEQIQQQQKAAQERIQSSQKNSSEQPKDHLDATGILKQLP